MRYLLNKRFYRAVSGISIVAIFVAGCNLKHREKAQQHLLKALQEYRQDIVKNPDDRALEEKYYVLARLTLGDIQAKIELALIYQETGKSDQATEILKQISTENPEQASGYLKKKLESAYSIEQRIGIYQALSYLNPQDTSYLEQLGRLYLGTNQTEKAIIALGNAINYGSRNSETIKYLVRAYINQNRYDSAENLLKTLISKKDDIQLREQLADVYKKQGKKDLYLAEVEKISEKKGKKKLIVFEKPEIQKIPELKKFTLGEKISVEPYTFLVVDKSLQKLFVYRFDGQTFEQLTSIVCTTGKNMDDKKRHGDLATPEGTFLIRTFIPGSNLEPKYGAGAYVLDFPDYFSQRQNKDGSGIWLHGTPIERPPYNSAGCIVVNDNDFRALQQYIEPGKTYIHILKQEKDMNLADFVPVWKTVVSWKQAWESLDTEKYLSYYADDFKSDGKDKKAWSQYKKKINKDKKYVKLELKDITIVPYGNTQFGYVFLIDAIQKYESNNLKSTTRKNFYLVKSNGTYKIIGELVK
ncbi:MAG: L,D-transpeptidase Cds6 family protein [Candidatus Ratteibacteria bacterium]